MTPTEIVLSISVAILAILVSILFKRSKNGIPKQQISVRINDKNELILTYRGTDFYNWKIDEK